MEPRCLCLGAHVRLQRKHQRRGRPLHRSPQAECGQLWAPERSPRKRPDTADPPGVSDWCPRPAFTNANATMRFEKAPLWWRGEDEARTNGETV